MQHGIREFRPRQPLDRQLSSDTLNRILRELESLRITRVVNGTFKKLPGGTEIVVAPQRGGGSAATPQPWDIYVTETEGEEGNITYTVKVRPGKLANILPSNWNEEFTCQSDTLYYGIVRVGTDGQFINSVTIDVTDQEPAQQTIEKFALNDSIDVLFGLFKDGTQYNLSGGANIDVSARVAIATSADPAAEPGQSPYDIYYKLQ